MKLTPPGPCNPESTAVSFEGYLRQRLGKNIRCLESGRNFADGHQFALDEVPDVEDLWQDMFRFVHDLQVVGVELCGCVICMQHALDYIFFVPDRVKKVMKPLHLCLSVE